MPKRKPQKRNPDVADPEPSAKRAARLTCKGCRLRKVRCDGGQPDCGICIAYSETCEYDRPPPMTQIRAMADKIAHLEQTLSELRSQNTNMLIDANTTSITQGSSVQTTTYSLSPTLDAVDASLNVSRAYYDTTSALHDPGDSPAQATTTRERVAIIEGPEPQKLQALPMESLDSGELKFWEDQAVQSAAVYLSLPQEVIRRLFATHWTWVHANFMFVPRAIFLRDAATGGKYFSPLLLTVLCLHSTRFMERHLTDNLLARAKLLLSHEIHNEGSIPLVQALLQFSAREIGRGSVSQAWLYAGMSFRIAIDIGLFSYASREPNGIEDTTRARVGHHLAWSCFLWDKTLSLYLGRTPSLPEPPKWDPAMPGTSETELWPPYPFSGGEFASTDSVSSSYLPRPSHLLLTFAFTCKISVVINDILLNIYGSKRTGAVLDFVQSTRGRLQSWRSNLPKVLQIEYHAEPCPPTHIVAQQ
ncbi:regulatory protein [Fusarium heterosporum]|uniref:Regulatory protein n=1 Tax=Fusarium heterosporum TaxID=42747 RepID=A0A8H5T226_FUSHE|nr:regulatory protein [Fusarium heterosporum]